jgi:hypothetical protein
VVTPMQFPPAPVWRVFTPVLEIQRLVRERPGQVPDGIEVLAAELSAALEAHAAFVRDSVEAALAAAPDDTVRERLDAALARLAGVKESVDYAIEALARDRENGCVYLEALLARSFAGVGVRASDNPFQLMAKDRSLLLPAAANAPAAFFTLADEDDLRPLHGAAFAGAIVACAEEHGRDPRRLFAFVSSIAHALYAGHFRAPHEVLADGVGNDADLAALLVELLRASGIRARLVAGGMRIRESVAAAWLDISDPHTLETCLLDAGFNVWASEADGVRLLDVSEHFHARALLDGQWLDLDPSVHPLEIVREGTRAWTAVRWTPAGTAQPSLEIEYLSSGAEGVSPLAFYEGRLRDAGVELDPRMRRRRPPDAAFPPPLPYESVGLVREQVAFESGQVHAIGLQLVGHAGTLIEHRVTTPGLCGGRITLGFVPATPTAEALRRVVPGPLAMPSFAFDLRPVLTLESSFGETVRVEGTAYAPMATPLFLQITLQHPNAMLSRRTEARPLCGTEWVMVIDGPGLLGSEAWASAAPEDPLLPLAKGARSWADFPLPLLRAYHRRLARAATRVAALSNAVHVSGPLVSMSAASLETFSIDAIAVRQRPSSLLIDVRNVELHLYDSTGAEPMAPFVELFLCEGSYHESQILQDRLGIESASTVTALSAAARQANPLRVVTADRQDEIDALQHPDRRQEQAAVRSRIRPDQRHDSAAAGGARRPASDRVDRARRQRHVRLRHRRLERRIGRRPPSAPAAEGPHL